MLSNIRENGNSDEKQFFVIDDPVGKHKPDFDELKAYETQNTELKILTQSNMCMLGIIE